MCICTPQYVYMCTNIDVDVDTDMQGMSHQDSQQTPLGQMSWNDICGRQHMTHPYLWRDLCVTCIYVYMYINIYMHTRQCNCSTLSWPLSLSCTRALFSAHSFARALSGVCARFVLESLALNILGVSLTQHTHTHTHTYGLTYTNLDLLKYCLQLLHTHTDTYTYTYTKTHALVHTRTRVHLFTHAQF